MLDRVIFSAAAVLLFVAEAQAVPKPSEPKECPIEDFAIDKIQDAARNAPSCGKSLEVFELCGAGATSDRILGGIVIEKCEADFIAKLSKSQRRAYDRAADRCSRKYQHEQGSMYRSFEAHCAAQVAERYSRRFLQRKTGGMPSRK